MNIHELRAELRELIGSPQVNSVTDRQLDSNLVPALEYLAAELRYAVRTDDNAIALTASQLEYPLPQDVSFVVWCEWNTIKLQPSTTFAWENDGTDWRDATASLPTGFAIQGRKLILNPPPSATAITTDGYLSLRYIASSPGLSAEGTPLMSRADQELVLLKAAIRYCSSHPTEENQVRMQGYQMQFDPMMKTAIARANHPIEDYQESFHVKTRRTSGAR